MATFTRTTNNNPSGALGLGCPYLAVGWLVARLNERDFGVAAQYRNGTVNESSPAPDSRSIGSGNPTDGQKTITSITQQTSTVSTIPIEL